MDMTNPMNRPVGMTWETPNAYAKVGSCVHPKPAFIDGGWIETFSKVQNWNGVWSRKHHWKTGEVVKTQDGCDTQIEWMLLDTKHVINPYTLVYYRYWVAYDCEYNVRAKLCEDGTGRTIEIDVVEPNNYRSEVIKAAVNAWR